MTTTKESSWKSKYFTFEEATFSSVASRNCIDNIPTRAVEDNMISAALQLDAVRELLGHPVHVDSWYRSEKLNLAVGGAITSSHKEGWSIDFVCPQFGTPAEIFQVIKESDIKFDQLILEFNRWVHISFSPRGRQEKLVYNGKFYRGV